MIVNVIFTVCGVWSLKFGTWKNHITYQLLKLFALVISIRCVLFIVCVAARTNTGPARNANSSYTKQPSRSPVTPSGPGGDTASAKAIEQLNSQVSHMYCWKINVFNVTMAIYCSTETRFNYICHLCTHLYATLKIN